MPKAGTGTGINDASLALARLGDPLVLANGKTLQPVVRPNFLPTIRQDTKVNPEKFRGKKPRNMSDLPGPPPLMNAVAAVLMYSFFGVGDREIADALRCDIAQLEFIRGHSAYSEFFELVSEQIVSADSDTLQNRIAAYSHAALDQVAHISVNGKREENQLRASIDLLDRGGHSAKNVSSNQQQMKNTLRIQLIKADGNETNVDVQIEQELG